MTRKPKTPAPVVHAIKAFDANLKCRDFQFEVGETYTHEGPVKACDSGFHSIIGNPLAVFNYYAPAGSRFCRVEISGEQSSDDQEKVASEILKVGTEIGLHDLIGEAVAWVTARATEKGEHVSGPRSAASATGYRSAASATGYRSAASATGNQSAASATGYQSAAMACGYGGAVSGKTGNALFAVERDESWNIVSVACGIVGAGGIKPGAWYRAKAGKLVAA